MKSIKYTLLTIAMTISLSAIANEGVKDQCEAVSNLAGTVMEARQEEVPMSYIMQEAGDNQLLMMLVERAYEYSALPTEEGKQRYILQFSNRIYSECLSAKKNQDMVKKSI